MDKLTEKEISDKYGNIEDKIPSVWKDFESAGINLSQDICYHWDVSDAELIRVCSLIDLRMAGKGEPNRFNLTNHIDRTFSYIALYPDEQKY